MSTRTILVTGGCGFIGSNYILEQIEAQPETRIINLDALTYAGNPKNLDCLAGHPGYRFVKGRIGDRELVTRILRDESVDAVVNFAAESHVDRSIDQPGAFVETNVLETTRLLQASLVYHRDLPDEQSDRFRFLHISTDEVFGSLKPDEAPFSEASPFAPNSPYAASKAAGDHLVRSFHRTYGLPVLTANCSNNYGPLQFPEKLIPLMISKAIAGDPLPIYGDGSNIRDWLYVRDHARAISTILEKGRVGETYCIGGETERDNLTIVKTICSILDRHKPKGSGSHADQITFVDDRLGHDFRYAIDPSKIRKELGWQPRMTFDQGIEETVNWYLENQAWCEAIHDGTYQDG